ncbi:MAG: hypothetical protein WCA77_06950 [Thermoplasmata archaeon]
MVPPKESEAPLSAPGLPELLSTPRPTIGGPRSARRHRNRPFRHVRLEVDLAPEPLDPSEVPVLEQLAGILKERKVVEQGNLIQLAAATLHALAARRFRRVEEWKFSPGAWLLPPSPDGVEPGEPVGDLLKGLEKADPASLGAARSFTARVTDLSGSHVDVTVRRVHRQRAHAMTLDLWGSWAKASVQDLRGSIAERLPVVHSRVAKYQYA